MTRSRCTCTRSENGSREIATALHAPKPRKDSESVPALREGTTQFRETKSYILRKVYFSLLVGRQSEVDSIKALGGPTPRLLLVVHAAIALQA